MVFAPLFTGLVFSTIYITGWYFKTRHMGAPPHGIISDSMLFAVPPSLWLSVLVMWLFFRKSGSFSDLFATRTNSLAKDILAGTLLGGFWIAIYGMMGYPSFSSMVALNLHKLQAVPGALSAGFCEEFIFRGLLIGLVVRAGGGKTEQVIWSAVLFGMAHIFRGAWGMLFTVLLGSTLAGVCIARRSIWPAVIAHSLLNLFIEP